jgi:hypothetical protein
MLLRPEASFDGRRCRPTRRLRRAVRICVALGVFAVALVVHAERAHAQETSEGTAMRANRGFHLRLGPTILLPMRDDGPYGGGLTLDARYGIRTGPVVLAPGGRASGYLISRRGVAMAMPTFRVTAPVGPLAP